MNSVKSRVPNFTNSEKAHLMRLIANKYAVILEDKKTDRASSTQKEKAWQAIENEFNASCSSSTYRNATCLKKCYENRKKELRKTLAEERKQTFLTGGGPPPKIKKDDTDDILKSILNEKTLVGLHNRFDDDANELAIEERDFEDIEYVYETEDLRDTESLTQELLQGTSTSTNISNSIGKEPTPNILDKKSESGKYMTGGEDYKTPSKKSRRRPATVIKPMTSSDIAKKYDLLLEKRLQLLDGQLKHMELQNALSVKKLELEIKILEIELAKKQ